MFLPDWMILADGISVRQRLILVIRSGKITASKILKIKITKLSSFHFPIHTIQIINLVFSKTIKQKQAQISRLEQTNRDIRAKYDSTLLEKIAGQPREQSINQVSAEKAKQELDKNNGQISTLKQENSNLQNQLLAKPESTSF